MFETVSFHIVKPCNMKCKFCYATFEDVHAIKQLPLDHAKKIINGLAKSGMEKITFAGGEPLLYRHINEVIKYSRSIGLTTSIISNGSLMTEDWLNAMRPHLDWIGISVDSLNPETKKNIGRVSSRLFDLQQLINYITDIGYRLKINTVVNRYNWQEDMSGFVKWANPDRWKIFQTLRVEGQNDAQFEEIKCTEDQFHSFVTRHRTVPNIVPEDNAAMTGSYLLVDPLGRLFENSSGRHTYSDTAYDHSIEHCLSQISLNRKSFISRGGLYNW